MNLTVRKIGSKFLDGARRGAAAVEFALTLPIWITLFLGASDGAYYLIINEKVDRIAYTVADIVTQYQVITKANLNDISLAAGQLMQPISFTNGNGVLIVTSVYQPATGSPVVEWQYTYPQNQSSQSSKVGTSSGTASLPNGLTLNANDNVIVSEVYYQYSPLFVGQSAAGPIYRASVYKPRLSPLTTPPT